MSCMSCGKIVERWYRGGFCGHDCYVWFVLRFGPRG